jgi:hypothetical protein
MGLVFAGIYLFFNFPRFTAAFPGAPKPDFALSDIIAVACGPVSLILASLAGLKLPRLAAYWLFAGGVSSATALVIKTWRADGGTILNLTNAFVMFAFFAMPAIVCGYLWLQADSPAVAAESETKSMAARQGQ